MKAGWTIGRKLMATFLLVSAITAGLGIVAYYGAVKSQASIEEVGMVRLPSVQSLGTIAQAQALIDAGEEALFSTSMGAAEREARYQQFADNKKQADDALKGYEALRHTDEETAIWTQFAPAWERWWKDHEGYVGVAREFGAVGIQDPPALQRDLQQFMKDHHALELAILDHVQEGKECKGDDPTACNYGRWLAKFKSDDATLRQLLDATRPDHDAVHAAVRHAKELVAKGDKEGAVNAVRSNLKEAIGKMFKNFDLLLAEADKASSLYDKMNAQMVPLDESSSAAETLIDRLVQINQKVAGDSAHGAKEQAGMLKTVSLGAAIIGVVAAMGLGILITRGINRNLSRIATQLNEGADQVNDAAGQVSSASQQLAEGASEQASSLEETSSALEQMAAMTRTSAGNAKEANDLAAQARVAASEGDKTMTRLNGAMTAIDESSKQISKIIKVIEEIAFQTNLLALNAAVEAARAGEHGKGFAVVADEVRNLAQRAAQAARETTGLIEGSVTRVREGTQVAGEVGKALSAIVADATKVSDLIAGISRASEEQAQGVDQVNTAVSQMDKVTQQNAAGAEESASAAEELSAQAQTVKGMVEELMALVGGKGTGKESGVSRTVLRHEPIRKRNEANVARVHKESRPAAGIAVAKHDATPKWKAGNAPSPAPKDFLDLDDEGVKEF